LLIIFQNKPFLCEPKPKSRGAGGDSKKRKTGLCIPISKKIKNFLKKIKNP
jgi:hypothetical protein